MRRVANPPEHQPWARPAFLSAGALAVFVSAAPLSAAGADVLSCDAFKTRLNEALKSADVSAPSLALTVGFADPVRGTRFAWNRGVNLNGSLNCGPAGQFEEFGMRFQFESQQTFAADLKRMMTMQAASICALASNDAAACTEFGRAMMQDALEQIGRKFSNGNRSPSGLADRTLFGTATAELVSAPSLITFVIGPGRGGAIEADRRPLPTPAKPGSTP